MADRDIDLTAAGPDPKNLVATPRDRIEIGNSTNYDVELILDNPKIFNPSPGASIEIAKGESWSGQIGESTQKCRYSYEAAGKLTALRTGTIEVG